MRALCDTKEFLQHLLPLPPNSEERLSSLLDALRQDGLYQDSEWVGLPSGCDSVLETAMYGPLVNLLEAINRRARENGGGGQNQDERLNGEWLNSHVSAPQSNNPNSTTSKPNIVFTSAANITATVSSLAKNHSHPQDGGEAVRQAGVGQNETGSEQPGEKGRTLWWLHVFAVLEVKAKKRASSLAQLATYVSQIFMEQFDRMFVFALTLNLDQLRVHLFDRSGIVSTYSIDIHENPMDFLHVIASFAWLPPQTLGWDATLRVWDGQSPVPSYTLSLELLQDCSSGHQLPWVVDGFPPTGTGDHASATGGPSNGAAVLSNDHSSAPQTSVAQYVTIRSLSHRESSRFWGRATTVFEVILLDDWIKKNIKAQIYVLKQSWQRPPGPESDSEVAQLNSSQKAQESSEWSEHWDSLRKDLETRPYEACIQRSGLDSSRLQEAGYVMSRGRKVETLRFILKDLTLKPVQSMSRDRSTSRSTTSRTSVTSSSCMDSQAEEEHTSRAPKMAGKPLQLVSRTLTRMVLKLPGLTIKFFNNRLELLNGLLGALNDHEELYKNGIIHRDVSINNIILSPSDPFGHLIDFDHSKITVRMTSFTSQPKPVGEMPQERILSLFHEDIVKGAARIHGWGKLSYYLVAVTSNWEPRDETRGFTLEDIGWTDTNGKADFYPIPSFNQPRAGVSQIMGTLAFMSHQLGPHDRLAHTAIHDMESLWWVLVYIAIIVGKPGSPREKEEMKEAMTAYFYDSEQSRHEKIHLFGTPKILKDLLAKVDDYFNDLKPLIEQWFEILRLAWMTQGVEFHYPHRVIRKLLKDTIANLDNETISQGESLKSKYRRETEEAVPQQKTVHMLAPKQTLATTPAQLALAQLTPVRPASAQPSKSTDRSPLTSPPPHKKFKRNCTFLSFLSSVKTLSTPELHC